MSEADEPDGGRVQAIPLRGWKFRYDSPPPGAMPWHVESGDVLTLFRSWVKANRADRRENERYTPKETHVYLGWWSGARFIVTDAEMINLSRGGALVKVDRRPPTSQPVWVCLGTPTPAHHVQARALDVTPGDDLDRLVRLYFHVPCPEDFFLAAGRIDEPADADEARG